jgi:hypothetical protein
MPKPKKMGRPPLPAKRRLGVVFAVRLRADEAAEVDMAIKTSSKPQSDWLREALLAAARSGRS